jgi:toxin FitB
MKLLDSNIIIYSAKPSFTYLKPLVLDRNNAVSIITKIEVLGFPNLSVKDKIFFEYVFRTLQIHVLHSVIVDKAIEIKQEKNMGTQDAIIAATAWLYDIELNTRNLDDFKHIQGIKIFNPIHD